MPGGVAIIVQSVDPGAIHPSHAPDEPADRDGVIAIFYEGVVKAGLADIVFIDISKSIGDQLDRDAVEGPVGKLDREGFCLPGMTEGFFDAVERGTVAVVIIFDIEGRAGGGEDHQEEGSGYRETIWGGNVHGFCDGGEQWVTPKTIFFRKRRLTWRSVRSEE